MPSKRARDAELAGRASDQDSNWAAKAQSTFKLLPPKTASVQIRAAAAEEQGAWQRYFAERTQAEAAYKEETEDVAEDCGAEECRPQLMDNVVQLLDSFKTLTKKERQLLASCVVIQSASADHADGDDVRNYQATARVYSVDGNSAVDVHHSYHNRVRGYGFEHRAEVSAAIRQPADEAIMVPVHGNKAGFSKLWGVTLKNTRTREQVYAENRRFSLTANKIKSFRKALFTGPQGKALGDKLDDYDLMLLLLTPVGVDEAGLGLPCGMDISHSCDDWDGVNLRRVCGAATEEDADWEETDFDADIEQQRQFDKEIAMERRRERYGDDFNSNECEDDDEYSDGGYGGGGFGGGGLFGW